MTTRVFIHGLESSSQGTKGAFFRGKYGDMIIEDYVGPLSQRMERLHTHLAGRDHLILVGSSYGGLMAALYACAHPEKMKKLILLAPALHLDEFKPCSNIPSAIPVVLIHGSRDDVVPPAPVRQIAELIYPHLTYRLVDDDHSLHRTFAIFDWDQLLEAAGNSCK